MNNLSQDFQSKLITDNMSIVSKTAKRLFNTLPNGCGIELDDLISEGYCALVKAASRYKSTQSQSFPNFVQIKANGAMIDYLRKLDILPQAKRTEIKHLQRQTRELENTLGRPCTEQEILKHTNLSNQKYREIIQNTISSSITYIDEFDYDFISTELSTISDTNKIYENLSYAIEKLPSREQLILQLYFYEDLNFTDISKVLRLSKPRISQLYKQSIKHLKHLLSETQKKS